MKKAGKFLTSVRSRKVIKELYAQAKYILAAQAFALLCTTIALYIFTDPRIQNINRDEVRGASTYVSLNAPIIPTLAPTIKKIPSPTPTQPTLTPHTTSQVKKTATQIDEVTWTVDVDEDAAAGTPQEIFQALNSYRAKNGKAALVWDPALASFAKSRADLFTSQGETDKHAGFNAFLDSDGFDKLGFNSLGENSSYGYHVSGTKLIEEVYASDAPHNDNQLSDKWTHVGIGVNGVATNLVFGGRKQ